MSPMHMAVRAAREKALPPMSEADLLRAVTDLATILGWSWVHFRPAQTTRGWRTPVSGPLGKGWPDLTLIRERDGQIIFVELKSQQGRETAEQKAVLDLLCSLPGPVDVAVWRPSDLDDGTIQRALR